MVTHLWVCPLLEVLDEVHNVREQTIAIHNESTIIYYVSTELP